MNSRLNYELLYPSLAPAQGVGMLGYWDPIHGVGADVSATNLANTTGGSILGDWQGTLDRAVQLLLNRGEAWVSGALGAENTGQFVILEDGTRGELVNQDGTLFVRTPSGALVRYSGQRGIVSQARDLITNNPVVTVGVAALIGVAIFMLVKRR